MSHVFFGLHSSGRMIDVAQAERGLACQCICVGCRGPLIARKGEIVVPHFAHAAGAQCAGGPMTALHKAAQQLIVEARRIPLPPLRVEVSKRHRTLGTFEAETNVCQPEEWTLWDAQTEIPIANRRVDVAGTDPSMGFVAIEVRVTHEVDPSKARDFALNDVPCVEIDLSGLIGRPLTLQELAKHLADDVSGTTWIHHPRRTEIEAQLLKAYPAWVEAQEREAAEYAKRMLEREAEQRRLRAEAEAARHKRLQAFDERVALVRDELVAALGAPYERWPRPISLDDLEGKRPFHVDGKLWHGVLFDHLIVGRTNTKRINQPLPRPNVIAQAIADRLGCSLLPTFNLTEASIAVRSYLNYLKACGMLEEREGVLWVVSEKPRPTRNASAPVSRNQWAEVWPFESDMVAMAHRFAQENGHVGWDPYGLVRFLCSCKTEPSIDTLNLEFARFGVPQHLVMDLLDALSVLRSTSQYVARGRPQPWDMDYLRE